MELTPKGRAVLQRGRLRRAAAPGSLDFEDRCNERLDAAWGSRAPMSLIEGLHRFRVGVDPERQKRLFLGLPILDDGNVERARKSVEKDRKTHRTTRAVLEMRREIAAALRAERLAKLAASAALSLCLIVTACSSSPRVAEEQGPPVATQPPPIAQPLPTQAASGSTVPAFPGDADECPGGVCSRPVPGQVDAPPRPFVSSSENPAPVFVERKSSVDPVAPVGPTHAQVDVVCEASVACDAPPAAADWRDGLIRSLQTALGREQDDYAHLLKVNESLVAAGDGLCARLSAVSIQRDLGVAAAFCFGSIALYFATRRKASHA